MKTKSVRNAAPRRAACLFIPFALLCAVNTGASIDSATLAASQVVGNDQATSSTAIDESSKPPATPPTSAPDTDRTKAFHVMIDPGHGGVDVGAVKGKLKESEIALKVSLKLALLLRNDPAFKVSLTRTSNQALTLPMRTQLAKEANADLFVSIHLNSSNDPRAHGKEFYFQNQLPADEEAMFLASRENAENGVDTENTAGQKTGPKSDLKKTDLKGILEDLHRNERILASSELSQKLLETWSLAGFGKKKSVIRQAPFYVVSNSESPSVLVEIGYLSHHEEGLKLASSDYQDELAKSLYNGLVKFRKAYTLDQR